MTTPVPRRVSLHDPEVGEAPTVNSEVPFQVVSPAAVAPAADIPDDVREHFRRLLRNLPWPGGGTARRITTVALTSCVRGDGVSTCAALTAVTAAGAGNHKVALIDANLAHPAVHRRFGIEVAPGLAEVVSGHRPPSAVLHAVWPGRLWVLTAGQAEPGRLYGDTERWARILAEMAHEFDLVVLDMPAIGDVASAMHLFGLFDGVVLVVEHERVRWEVAQKKRQGLLRARANLVGVAFNKRTEHIPAWLYRTL